MPPVDVAVSEIVPALPPGPVALPEALPPFAATPPERMIVAACTVMLPPLPALAVEVLLSPPAAWSWKTEPPPLPIHLVHATHGAMPLKMRRFLDFAAPRLRLSVACLDMTTPAP